LEAVLDVLEASPGLKAGRGLKQNGTLSYSQSKHASPGLKAGRGLKLVGFVNLAVGNKGIARPQGRARIETGAKGAMDKEIFRASPGLKAGRGLKLHASWTWQTRLWHRPASRPGAD